MKPKSLIITLCSVLIILITFSWATTFLFVVQPIGAIPEGTIVWMWKPDRLLTEKVVPFVCSADGILLEEMGYVNLISRVIMISSIMKVGDKITTFPYNHSLYLISTGGKEFEY